MDAKTYALLTALVTFAYHVYCFDKDAVRWQANLQQYKRNKTVENFGRLVLAEGILIKDLGWLFG